MIEPHLLPERRLWLTVLANTVSDANWQGSEYSPRGCFNERAYFKRTADHWLRHSSREFRMVCDLAGMDPVFIRDAYISGKLAGFTLYDQTGNYRVKQTEGV